MPMFMPVTTPITPPTTTPLQESRAARYTLNTVDSDAFVDGKKNYGLLDEMMYEIPGKDNYMVGS